jgi:trehalose 6-phosphate phosphatase
MDIAAFTPDLEKSAILLDVDGTIVDFAPTPREVWVPADLRDILARLTEQTDGAMALVSGRPIADLDLIFAPLLLTAIGGHGAEFRLVNDGQTEHRRPMLIDARLKRELAAIAELGPGIIVEDKGYSLALHYRLAPERGDQIRNAVAKIAAMHASEHIEVLPGKYVVEVKPKGFNKATGVRALMTRPPFAGRVPIFIGDDTTDEPAFEIMSEFKGIAFSVGRKASGATASFEAPQDVRAWLQRVSQQQETAFS